MTISIAGMAPMVLNSTTIAVTGIRVSAGIPYRGFKHSGNEFASVGIIPGAIPRVSFQTPFFPAYSLIGLKQLALTQLDLYFAVFTAAGLRQPTATANAKMGIASTCSAVCYISGASVSQSGILMATVECYFLSSGPTVQPWVRTNSLALPTFSSQPQLHTLGPIAIGATPTRYDGLSQSGFQQNISLLTPMNDGDQYLRTTAWSDADPTIGMSHDDPLTLETLIGLFGEAIPTQVVMYYRAVDPTTQLLDTTGLSFTVTSGAIIPDSFELAMSQIAKMALSVKTLSTSGTHPIAVASGVTLP